MNRTTMHALALAVAVALAGAAAPARSETLSRGTVELTPEFSFTHSGYSVSGESVGSTTEILARAGLFYSTSNLVAIGGGLLIQHQSVHVEDAGTASATGVGLSGGVTLNFSSSSHIVPFVRGEVGFESFSGDALGGSETAVLAPILTGGVRCMVGSTAAVNFAAFYAHVSNANGENDVSANQFGITVGLSIFPGRAR